ncbi:MAG: tetratricopeptide repeat protein [Candidatus Korobacteraceae bacterium]|jgi:tetratricopeptide (TPR) repeat protein
MNRFARPLGLFALCLILLSATAGQGANREARFVLPTDNAIARKAFDDFYNQDYDRAIRAFETLAKEHPADPFATNYLLQAVMFKELARIGALDTEGYADDSFLNRKVTRPLDAAARTRILELESRAEAQANALLAKNPDDVDALYARGSARAMRCAYMGMAEKAWFSGLRAALGARRDHERVLELDPSYVDAKLTVGFHNYVVGSLTWPMRVSASIIGVGGNKHKGLAMLREVSRSNTPASPDAKISLALFLRREQQYPEALELVRGMTAEHPRSFLTALEYANLLSAAGRGPEAIASYRQILTNCKEKKYALPEPAKAAFLLGIVLRGQRRFQEAAEAFDQAADFPGADRELSDRAILLAGEMYDTILQRQMAVKRYETVLATGKTAPLAEIARKHMEEPFQYK